MTRFTNSAATTWTSSGRITGGGVIVSSTVANTCLTMATKSAAVFSEEGKIHYVLSDATTRLVVHADGAACCRISFATAISPDNSALHMRYLGWGGRPPILPAVSGGHCNASASFCDDVIQLRGLSTPSVELDGDTGAGWSTP